MGDLADAAPDSLLDRVGVVVTVHDEAGTRLERCVASIALADPGIRIVVVDNSGRPDRDELAAVTAARIVRVATSNAGFGAAANLGVRHPSIADATHVVVMNDDVVVDRGWLRPLVDALDAEPALGAVQPKLLLADTTPTLVNSLGVQLDPSGAGSDVGYRTPDDPTCDVAGEIDIFTGGAVALRRAFFDDVGGFDERLFLYYEDVDLALRGAERGWRYRCISAARVEHAMGASTDALADERIRLQERNRLVTAARFGSPATIGRALWLSIRRLRHAPRGAHARALVGGLARLPRALLERLRVRRDRR